MDTAPARRRADIGFNPIPVTVLLRVPRMSPLVLRYARRAPSVSAGAAVQAFTHSLQTLPEFTGAVLRHT